MLHAAIPDLRPWGPAPSGYEPEDLRLMAEAAQRRPCSCAVTQPRAVLPPVLRRGRPEPLLEELGPSEPTCTCGLAPTQGSLARPSCHCITINKLHLKSSFLLHLHPIHHTQQKPVPSSPGVPCASFFDRTYKISLAVNKDTGI